MSHREDVLKLHAEGKSFREIARELGIDRRGVARCVKRHGQPTTEMDPAPEGYVLKGTSTLVDAKGAMKLQWIKTAVDHEKLQALTEAACRAALSELPPIPAVPPPSFVIPELCTLYTITDYHMGMLSWERETGAAWDLPIAERTLMDCVTRMVLSSPPARVGILSQLGDFNHFDSMRPVTPEHGHLLDADSRFQKLVETTVRCLRRIVEIMLQKHEQVIVIMEEGNHDPVSSVWLRVLFAALYANNPRVRVEQSPLPYVTHRHGSTLLGFHHGHLSKNASLPLLFAARFREDWGQCKYVYIHTGHRHHVEEKEHPGAKVIQHATLAAPDAYAARGGWISERQAVVITYHSETGEYCRNIIVPQG